MARSRKGIFFAVFVCSLGVCGLLFVFVLLFLVVSSSCHQWNDIT